MTTPDRWRAASCSTRWSPIVAACLLSWAAVGLVGRFGPDERLGTTGTLGRHLVALSLGFLADDLATDIAPAAPMSVRSRFLGRAAVGIPLVASGWSVALLIEKSATPRTVAIDPLAAITLACSTLCVALAASHRRLQPSPGAIGVAVIALLATTATVIPQSWIKVAPHGTLLAAAVVSLLVVCVWTSTAEPTP